MEVVDKFGNLVETESYPIYLTMVGYSSNEENQDNTSVGNFYIEDSLSVLGSELSEASIDGVSDFIQTKYADGADSNYPILNKLYAFTYFGESISKIFKEITILKGPEYEITNISYSYDGGAWASGTSVDCADSAHCSATYEDIHSDVTAYVTIKNLGNIDAVEGLMVSKNVSDHYVLDPGTCDDAILLVNDECVFNLTYKYDGGSGTIGDKDTVSINISDADQDGENLITLLMSGHRKNIGSMVLKV